MKKFALFGLVNDTNYGDQVIYITFKYLLENTYENNINIEGFDFIYKKNYFQSLIFRALNKFKFIRLNTFLQTSLAKQKYINKIKGFDYIILAGGGLIKYKYHDFDARISGLIQAATKRNVPVIINSIGVEGYDENNFRCLHLKKYLNKKIVKKITTRDDYELLKKYIYNKEIETLLTVDPAIFTDRVYGVGKDKSSKKFGIGLIRQGIFKDNGIEVSAHELINLYVDIIKYLENKGYEVELFTNGLSDDYDLGLDVLKKLENNSQKPNIVKPKSDKELVEIISSFRGIISARMHSMIIAYSLNIPAIGLVWNDKITLWGKHIYHPDYFFQVEEFNVNNICDKLISVINKEYNNERKEELKNILLKDIDETIKC